MIFPRLSFCTVFIMFTIAFLIIHERPNCTLQKPLEEITPSYYVFANYSRAHTTRDPKSDAEPNCEDLNKTVMKTGRYTLT